jgi:hypothetical protein
VPLAFVAVNSESSVGSAIPVPALKYRKIERPAE